MEALLWSSKHLLQNFHQSESSMPCVPFLLHPWLPENPRSLAQPRLNLHQVILPRYYHDWDSKDLRLLQAVLCCLLVVANQIVRADVESLAVMTWMCHEVLVEPC